MQPAPFSITDIEKAISVKVHTQTNNSNSLFSGISTDSRNIQKSDLFVALKGDNFDGADYVAELFQKILKVLLFTKVFLNSFQ